MYERDKFFESSEEFQKVIYNYPGATIVDTAQYYLALSYMHDKQYELAAVEFDRLIRSYPRSVFVTESHYRVGYCYFHSAPKHYGLDQTELVKSIKLMEEFILDYPDSDVVPEAQEALREANTRLSAKDFKAAVQYTHIRAWESARIYFQRVLDLHPGSEHAILALLGKGETLYYLSKWDDAAQTLNSYLALYPESEETKKARKLLAKIESERPAQPAETADNSDSSDSTSLPDSSTTQSSAIDQ
ncbi:outer membrane protein assembly factor BamD [Gemmatimonas aurantiaca]|nr:outer membrane protein assembly factor BamD [Gemmatimonas aurantiaca]